MSSTTHALSGIYRITCAVTGGFYIGSSINLSRRWSEHRNSLRKNAHSNRKLQHAWNKYGEDVFIFEILELVLSAFLIEREQYWLDTLKPFGDKGFNLAIYAQAGCLGIKMSPEACAKMSKAKLGKPSPRLGSKAAPETIERLRISHLGHKPHNKGKKASPETIEKLRVISTGNTYRRGTKTSPDTCEKIRLAGIGNTNRRGTKTSPEGLANLRTVYAQRAQTLILVDPEGNEYKTKDVTGFCKERNLNPSNLFRVAKGLRNHHKGWTARYPETE